jgi:Ca-activated chloride channel homolog
MLKRPSVSPFAVFAVAVILVVAAWPALAEYDCEPIDMGAVGCGELLWRHPDGLVPLPAVSTDVVIEVNGPLIAGTVSQRFVNPTDEVIEAVYVFPMPENAAVHAMEIIVGERRIVSIVQEKAEARRTYETAKAAGQRTALVEQQRPNLFTTAVANICPGDEIVVELGYLDRADYVDGGFAMAFPLTFTPRYIPPSQWRSEEGAREAAGVISRWVAEDDARYPAATLRVDLNPGVEIEGIASASHDLSVDEDDGRWYVTPAAVTVPADRDFLLAWRPVASADPLSALFVEDREDGRYALLMIVPAVDERLSSTPRVPTETVFLVDVSGSMQGASIIQARTALTRALNRLTPRDRFNIMSFSNDSRLYRRHFSDGDPAVVADARAWVNRLQADGGTNMHPALLRAMSCFLGDDESTAGFSKRIILITDAAIGNESQLLREAATDLGSVRLHVVGIGGSPNRYLVRRLAEYGGGLTTFVSTNEGAENGIDTFLERVARPQIAQARLDWEGAVYPVAYPTRLPELYAGELMLWSGRFPPDADLKGTFSAEVAGRTLIQDLEGPCEHSAGVAVRWAREKVAGLMADFHSGVDRDIVRERVVETGLAFGLITKFTSRVAVEEAISTDEPPVTCRMPNGLPHGTEFASTLPNCGTTRPLLRMIGWLALLFGAGALIVARFTGGRS